MSSDEDFSLVVDPPQPSEDTLEGIQLLTSNYKKKYDQLIQEQKELHTAINEGQELTQEFKLRSKKLIEVMEKDKQTHEERMASEETHLESLKQEIIKLMEDIEAAKADLKQQEATNDLLQQKSNVFNAVPERDFVFTGVTGKPDDKKLFDMKAQIIYPMEGGTALVTFEDTVVADKILKDKEHRVDLGGECHITVEAKPVHLLLPSLVEIDTDICPHRILISNLPKMETESMLNKLEIHFSKSKNKGGEVDTCEWLPDSETVVVRFLEADVAKRLTEIEYHEVKLQEKNHRVRVTPFLNGNITNLETVTKPCPRTVLLTGIPDVMDQDILQDVLEIHFQKTSNGGGEIEAFLYNPLGKLTSAVFEDIPTDNQK